MIELENVSFVYNEGTPFQSDALKNVSLKLEKGEIVALIGHTGSGKSTLLQLLNGLLYPSSGRVTVDGIPVARGEDLKSVRRKVGLVFQYPEYQLFEETVEADISFAPKNYGLQGSDLDECVKRAFELTGLDYEKYRHRSPFFLSGGEKRRVAIAGVLSGSPEYLILDEPTAGLDPVGREEILRRLTDIGRRENIAILLVSHSMEDVAREADRILVLKDGKLVSDRNSRETFGNAERLGEWGLSVPDITDFMLKYRQKGHEVRMDVLTVEEAKEEILKEKHRKGQGVKQC